MKEWFYEFLFVLAASSRTRWAIILGPLFYFGILMLGSYMTSNFELNGGMKVFEEAFVKSALNKYDKVAFGALVSFWILAFKFYHKDKNKFY